MWHRRCAVLLVSTGLLIIASAAVTQAAGWDRPWRPELAFALGFVLTALGTWFFGVFDRAR